MNKDFLTWEDTNKPGFCEVTLHGDKKLMDKRIDVLTEAAKSYRISNPEWYLLLMNMATQIADQLYFNDNDRRD